jgi:hypothetical protein
MKRYLLLALVLACGGVSNDLCSLEPSDGGTVDLPILQAGARVTAALNLGVTPDPNDVALSQQTHDPELTTGIIPGAGYTDSHGRRIEIRRTTPAEDEEYNSKLLHVASCSAP